MSELDPRTVLARYRGAIGPSTTQRERLFAAVDAATPSAVPIHGAARPRWAKLVVVGAGLVAAAMIGVALRSATPQPAEVAVGTQGRGEASDGAQPPRVEAPAEVTDATAPASTVVTASSSPLEPRVDAAQGREPTVPRAQTPRRRTDATRERERRVVADGGPPEPVRSVDATAGVDAEVALLREASLALRQGRSHEAATLLDRHAREFADGALVELREFERARLRCEAVGDRDAVIAGFRARFPDSPHLARLQRGCGA